MAKVRVLEPITGCINGVPWPEVGGEVDLPDSVAADMAAAGAVEVLKPRKVEKRPSAVKAEKRG